jgi:hypothetical protein
MAGPFGIDGSRFGDARIEAGLDRLTTPPDWLISIEDKDRLRADLERSIPELVDGSVRLMGCKFKRAHIDPDGWTSLCRLKIEDADGSGRREVDVRGRLILPGEAAPVAPAAYVPFESDGWWCYLPELRWELTLEPPDQALPAMDQLTDPDRSGALLERAFRAGGAGREDLRLETSEPTVMRYREGRRVTIRYELGYRPEDRRPDWPAAVIAKVYEGDDGQVTYDAMRAMWASPLRTSATVRIAEPLAFIPEENLLVQGMVPGTQSLKDLIETSFGDGLADGIEAIEGLVRKAGRGLAEMHASGAAGGPVVTWEGHVAAVRHAEAELAAVIPEMSGAMEPLVTRLEELAQEVPAGPLVPTHRSFRPAQILVDGADIAFIDFDGFCQAEAGLDLALFRTTLVDLCLRGMEEDGAMAAADLDAAEVALDELCATFLDAYAEVAPLSIERLALWDAITSTKDILDCWRKVKFEHLDRRMHFLHRRLGTAALADAAPPATADVA